MIEQKHIINRQVLEFTIPDRDRVQFIQNRTSEILSHKLHPALDALFSRLSGSEEIFRIDKLEVDLGTISENKLEQDFVEIAVRKIETQVNLLLKSRKNTAKEGDFNGKLPGNKPDFVTTTKSKDYSDQFVFFLLTGYFPWWHNSAGKNEASAPNVNRNIFKEVLDIDGELLKNAIIPLLKKEQVRKRLIFQFNHSYLYELLKKLDADLFESYSAQFRDLLSCSASATFKRTLTDCFYGIVFEYFSRKSELKTGAQKIGFVKDILDLSIAKQSEREREAILTEIILAAKHKLQNTHRRKAFPIVVAVIQIATELSLKSQNLQRIILGILEKKEDIVNYWIAQYIGKKGKDIVKRIEGNKEVSVEIFRKIASETNSNPALEKDDRSFPFFPPDLSPDTETIMISNAGLVLVHPFLKYFFEGLNLLNRELQFKSPDDTFKAIHLLQFMATGEETAGESELVLNKILCGLEITEPVPKSVLLSDDEKAECTFLMRTVLERWEALRTGNPATLRDTYLKREGILKRAGHTWSLLVERNTFDVMLERLPWSVSLVKLPWCGQILYVEW